MEGYLEKQAWLKERAAFIENIAVWPLNHEEKFEIKDGNISAFRTAVARAHGSEKFAITKTSQANLYNVCRIRM